MAWYDPSPAGSLVFAIIFLILLLAHGFQAARAKAWYMTPLLIATAGELIGYIFRYVTAVNSDAALWQHILCQVGLIVSPAFLQAQLYMIVGRIMGHIGTSAVRPIIGHGAITKVFVIADVLAIVVQASSSAMLTSDNLDTMKLGHKLILVGLWVQVISFAAFLLIAVHFHVKARRAAGSPLTPLMPLMIGFYVAAVLIIGRSIYRAAEFGSISFTRGEPSGYLVTHEWPFYVLDSVPIVVSTAIFNVFHPARFLQQTSGEAPYALQEKKLSPSDSEITVHGQA